ncbi:type II secretion system protein [Pseudomonas aeruginosa]
MKSQKGFTLIELILCLGLTAMGTMLAFNNELLDLEQKKARTSGQQLFQLNNAIAAWTTANAGAPNQTHTDTTWLKSTSCTGGTSAVAYLPCSFPKGDGSEPLLGGKLTISSVVTTSGAPPNQVTSVTTTTSAYTLASGAKRSDLSGLAAFTAAAASNGLGPSTASTSRSYTSDPATAIVTLMATNSAGNNAWLRTDGGNSMNMNFDFKSGLPATSREIQGVSRIQAIAATALTVGNSGGAAAGYGVVVDANKSNLGTLAIQNTTNAPWALTANVGEIRASSGSITASGSATASGDAVSRQFVDSQNTAYYGDPAGASVLNEAYVGQDVRAGIFYDINNSTYHSAPANGSKLNTYTAYNSTTTGQATVFGNYHATQGFDFQTNTVPGTGCSANGMVSMESRGLLVVCSAGVWKKLLDQRTQFYDASRFPATAGLNQQYLGVHKICSLAGASSTGGVQEGYCDLAWDNAGNWWLNEYVDSSKGVEHRCYALCNAE